MMGQYYWLGKTKLSDRPKMPPTSFNRTYLFNRFYTDWQNDLLTDQLTDWPTYQPTDRPTAFLLACPPTLLTAFPPSCLPTYLATRCLCNFTMTKAMHGLDYFCCLTSLWSNRCLLAYNSMYNAFFMDSPVPSSVYHSSLLTVKSVDSVVAHDGFLFVTKKFPYFSYWLLFDW